jgi:hypothetical protein
MNSSFERFCKIALIKNGKIPINKWSEKKNHLKEVPDMKKYNVSILTGPINDLLVVDIDVKDDGLKEWLKFTSKQGEPKTTKVQTPSGGLHYYFKYKHEDESMNYVIKHLLNNRTKLKGIGIDIRSEGGYVVAPPSKINEKEYKLVNDTEIIELPLDLVEWLISDVPVDELVKMRDSYESKTT